MRLAVCSSSGGAGKTSTAANLAVALGLRDGDSVFGLHHPAHAPNAKVGADSLAGQDARSMRDAAAKS